VYNTVFQAVGNGIVIIVTGKKEIIIAFRFYYSQMKGIMSGKNVTYFMK
jgi:hypothetical protein